MIIDTRLIQEMDIDLKIEAINKIKMELHKISPFSGEPVDCVVWVKSSSVVANDYNPNTVAPAEMKLLETSISHDGYTQPIVTSSDGDDRVVIDGFHRHRVGKECGEVSKRIHGYLPVVQIRESQDGRNDRIASTIRHNRARGKHRVTAMSDIVIELVKRNWTDERIGNELGMDRDEVTRLKQISGLAEVFADSDFSEAWEPL